MEKRTSISRQTATKASKPLSARTVSCPVAPAWRTRPISRKGRRPEGVGATLAQPGHPRHRFRRRRPAAGDSLAGRCSCGGGHPLASPYADGGVQVDGPARHRVRHQRPRPATAAQSNWRTLVPRVGALSVQPTAPAVPPVSASSISLPRPVQAASVITLSPVFARPGAPQVNGNQIIDYIVGLL